MKGRNALLTVTCLIASVLLMSPRARSTAGFAEWQVSTPGGNVILHADGWKETYGDCLKADDRDSGAAPNGREKVYVSHLKRWQYYNGYVAGESQKGFFLFNETSKQVVYYTDEQSLLEAVNRKNLGNTTSNWLTGADGWAEAWYPFMVWQPCKKLLSQRDRPPAAIVSPLSKEECRQALSQETLRRYRETTWGRECRQFQTIPLADQKRQPEMQAFCKEILESR